MTQSMTHIPPSPFHRGEKIMQARAGKSDSSEALGQAMIRDHMPDQHRDFFSQLPFVVLGGVDAAGWPWATLLPGAPGFITSPDPRRLDIDASPTDDNPMAAILSQGNPIGVLGIEVPTRRRNRMNARVITSGPTGFALGVDQSFGNCPQYIQTRDIQMVRDPAQVTTSPAPTRLTQLDKAARDFITQADTFFVASATPMDDTDIPTSIRGADVSHRGGQAGFVRVTGDTLTIPDYSGNNAFNTLGNFLLNPKAGLVFPDFATGDLLMLTGNVTLIDADDPTIQAFDGADRGWTFTLDHGIWLRDVLPFRADFSAYSPNSLMTGDWAQADAIQKAQALANTWRTFRVAGTTDESRVIRSFHLMPDDADPALPFAPGQFLTLQVHPNDSDKTLVRTYTVSSGPSDPGYRISVKREPGGVVSNHLHDNLAIGDRIQVKAPKGAFHLDTDQKRPAVLLAGGVGITPMIAMARHVIATGKRTRHTRPLTILHSTQDTTQRAFASEFAEIVRVSGGAVRYVSLVDNPQPGEQIGVDFNGTGYVTADVLRQVLPLDDYDFYLCGPPGFMQAVYGTLRGLGVRDARIQAEAFGPAALKRSPDATAYSETHQPQDEAETAIVQFSKSGFEQSWSRGDATLLETAEAHGLAPPFSCRSGTCGSCVTRLRSGQVTYRTPPSADHDAENVLICCAVPAKDTPPIDLDL